ncbi:hypothetical protein N4G63_016095 [Aquabacterium sp. OR-4]|nr:hypothetical protein [Aquabacterium sp. OR-4]MDT7836710.1 hypothetical protein [Aquabacterium sp. OR-4]
MLLQYAKHAAIGVAAVQRHLRWQSDAGLRKPRSGLLLELGGTGMQHGGALADHGLRRVAEHAAEGRVHHADAALRVEQRRRVGHHIERRPQRGFAAAQGRRRRRLALHRRQHRQGRAQRQTGGEQQLGAGVHQQHMAAESREEGAGLLVRRRQIATRRHRRGGGRTVGHQDQSGQAGFDALRHAPGHVFGHVFGQLGGQPLGVALGLRQTHAPPTSAISSSGGSTHSQISQRRQRRSVMDRGSPDVL